MNVGVLAEQAQQIPHLLLANAHRLVVVTYIEARQAIAQPAAGIAHHCDVLGQQAELFVEFAKQSLFGRFFAANAALRKLPSILTDTTRPQKTAAIIA